MSKPIIYKFKGGLINHRRRNDLCKLGWQLKTDPKYWIVYFLRPKKNCLNMEICRIDNLEKQND